MAKTDKVEIPEEYAERGEAWNKAFYQAYDKGCSVKAAILFAEAHYNDYVAGVESLPDNPDMLKAKIAELEAKLASGKK